MVSAMLASHQCFSSAPILCSEAKMWHSFMLRAWVTAALCMLSLSFCLHSSAISSMLTDKNIHWKFSRVLLQVNLNPIFSAQKHIFVCSKTGSFLLQKLLQIINWLDHHCELLSINCSKHNSLNQYEASQLLSVLSWKTFHVRRVMESSHSDQHPWITSAPSVKCFKQL